MAHLKQDREMLDAASKEIKDMVLQRMEAYRMDALHFQGDYDFEFVNGSAAAPMVVNNLLRPGAPPEYVEEGSTIDALSILSAPSETEREELHRNVGPAESCFGRVGYAADSGRYHTVNAVDALGTVAVSGLQFLGTGVDGFGKGVRAAFTNRSRVSSSSHKKEGMSFVIGKGFGTAFANLYRVRFASPSHEKGGMGFVIEGSEWGFK
eukprot:6782731-Prymnesium_polylepis.1